MPSSKPMKIWAATSGIRLVRTAGAVRAVRTRRYSVPVASRVGGSGGAVMVRVYGVFLGKPFALPIGRQVGPKGVPRPIHRLDCGPGQLLARLDRLAERAAVNGFPVRGDAGLRFSAL